MEQKQSLVTFKARKGAISENQFEFEASTIGNPDRVGDVFMPGAFSKAVMTEAVKKGWADVSHGWSGEPIGWFDEVKMESDTLVIKGTYHSTVRAQEMRTVTKERLDNGKEVAVSIGFNYEWDKSRQFESGSELLKWAEGQGYDMSKLDVPAIKKLRWCMAITNVTELFECSICNVGMNPRARVRDTKSAGQKSQKTTVGAILQAKIHQSFTVAADELAIRGYMDTDERIALSGAIGESLKLFRANIDPDVAERDIDPYDVDWVASKQFEEGDALGQTLPEALKSALAAVKRAAEVHAQRAEGGRTLSKTHLPTLAAIQEELAPLLAALKAETDPGEMPDTDSEEAALAIAAATLATTSL